MYGYVQMLIWAGVTVDIVMKVRINYLSVFDIRLSKVRNVLNDLRLTFWAFTCQKYPVYIDYLSPTPEFSFSSQRPFQDNCTEWSPKRPWTLKGQRHPYMVNYCHEVLNFSHVCSTMSMGNFFFRVKTGHFEPSALHDTPKLHIWTSCIIFTVNCFTVTYSLTQLLYKIEAFKMSDLEVSMSLWYFSEHEGSCIKVHHCSKSQTHYEQ